MKLISTLSCFFALCLTSSYGMDFSRGLDLEKNYSVLTVTRDRIPINLTPEWEYAPHNPLSGEIVDEVLKRISSILQAKNDFPIFVVFNEYFFSKEVVLSSNDSNSLLEKLYSTSEKHSNAIFCVNFLHFMDGDIPSNTKEKLKKYTQSIDGEGVFLWSILSSPAPKISDDKSAAFSNESFMIFKGKQLISHKKSAYFHENDVVIGSNNYVSGFGVDVISSDLDEVYLNVANSLHKSVCIEICWDIQKHIRAWRNDILKTDISFMNDTVQDDIGLLRSVIREYPTSFDSYKMCIIQSNFTNINEVIHDFPNGIVIVQADPISPGAIRIQHPTHVMSSIDSMKKIAQEEISKIEKQELPSQAQRKMFGVNNKLNAGIECILKQNLYRIVQQIPVENLEPLKLKTTDDIPVNFSLMLYSITQGD